MGRKSCFIRATQPTRGDVLTVSLEGDHRVQPLLQTPFDEQEGTISPDGRWIAYESDSSGHRKSTSVRSLPSRVGNRRSPPRAADGLCGRVTDGSCST